MPPTNCLQRVLRFAGPFRLSILILLVVATGRSQGQPVKRLAIKIINHSSVPVLCVLNDLTPDTVDAGRELVINKATTAISLPGYFFVYFMDLEKKRPGNPPVRLIYSSVKGREIRVSDAGISFVSNSSEKFLDNFLNHAPVEGLYEYTRQAVVSHAGDIASADIVNLNFIGANKAADTVRWLYELLKPAVQGSVLGRQLIDYVHNRERLVPGRHVESFTLADTAGMRRSLSDVKSKYILLDFWFSFCGPCIESFTDMKKMYGGVDHEKLEIIGISIDNAAQKEIWRSTVHKQQLPWMNLHDPSSAVAFYTFAIGIYPTSILLDQDRNIVKVDPEISEILDIIR